MHVNLSETIHNTCWSKKLIWIINLLGLCTDEVERIDTALADHALDMDDCHRVPVPPPIIPFELVHGASYNFDHKENRLSDIGGSHDTILMVFQNIKYIKFWICS